MSKSLFELSNEIMELDALLYTVEDDEEGMKAILDGYASTLEDDLEVKLDNYCAFISELEQRSSVRKYEAERLLNRSKIDANKATRLKEVLRWFFQTHEVNYHTTKVGGL